MTPTLEHVLDGIGSAAIAVSGGVDSMTLAVMAGRHLGPENTLVVHAVSPAVPPEATGRVRAWARKEGWRFRIIDAGEFADENYRSNPVNRCFFCKGNLYGALSRLGEANILSGTNTDDLGEYRPGLDAAKHHSVRHPFVEAAMDKSSVRRLARRLGLGDLAELPSSPCLSSRVETSIRIEPAMLEAIHAVENLIRERLRPNTVRCRLRQSGIVIELDERSFDAVSVAALGDDLIQRAAGLLPPSLAERTIGFAVYRNGSAFLRAPS